MTVARKILGVLLICAALAAAYFGVRVCRYAMDAEPYIEGGAAAATATLEHFLSCLEAKDFSGAYGDMHNYASLGLEDAPDDPIARMYWDALLSAWHFDAAADSQMQGTRYDRRVTVRCLDFDAISAEIGRRVQAILTEKVENARLRSEVYDENGNYKEELAYDALTAATAEVLADTAPYAYTQECSLSLYYIGDRWEVEVTPAFISALTAGAARG